VLDRIQAADPATLPDKGPSYDEELLGELPHEARGLCMFRLGRYAEAAEEYAVALSYAPDNAEYRAKLALSTARSRSRAVTGA
jgi:Flp pilus assembly protein TadD